jgi:hypothetical protein
MPVLRERCGWNAGWEVGHVREREDQARRGLFGMSKILHDTGEMPRGSGGCKARAVCVGEIVISYANDQSHGNNIKVSIMGVGAWGIDIWASSIGIRASLSAAVPSNCFDLSFWSNN